MIPVIDTAKPKRLGNHVSFLHGTLDGNIKTAIGIDPGSGFGLTIIDGSDVKIFYGKLPQEKEKGLRGVHAYNYIMKILPIQQYAGHRIPVVIEGAAYNARFGQVGLEEVRIGFYIALHQLGFDVRIEPPATIRKLATGSGRDTIGNYFPSLNHDAADSIGCALAALKLNENYDTIET